MTDWRYWITYTGRVTAENEAQARVAALEAQQDARPIEVELEEIEPVEGEND